jgi:hypothetical protein
MYFVRRTRNKDGYIIDNHLSFVSTDLRLSTSTSIFVYRVFAIFELWRFSVARGMRMRYAVQTRRHARALYQQHTHKTGTKHVMMHQYHGSDNNTEIINE